MALLSSSLCAEQSRAALFVLPSRIPLFYRVPVRSPVVCRVCVDQVVLGLSPTMHHPLFVICFGTVAQGRWLTLYDSPYSVERMALVQWLAKMFSPVGLGIESQASPFYFLHYFLLFGICLLCYLL